MQRLQVNVHILLSVQRRNKLIYLIMLNSIGMWLSFSRNTKSKCRVMFTSLKKLNGLFRHAFNLKLQFIWTVPVNFVCEWKDKANSWQNLRVTSFKMSSTINLSGGKKFLATSQNSTNRVWELLSWSYKWVDQLHLVLFSTHDWLIEPPVIHGKIKCKFPRQSYQTWTLESFRHIYHWMQLHIHRLGLI